MSDKRNVTCIICPVGCRIEVELENEDILNLSGYRCKRGLQYAKDEVTSPKRILTTTVRLKARSAHVLPVRTRAPIPRSCMKDAMKELKSVFVCPPVKMGDVVLKDVAGTGVDVIASRSWTE
ncbi:MAG TPA: DUF1667 domain-containing protein [Thermoanaerobacterales bacterium]|nr:DUF1667 domain-containing protein [Thermoanaerobacterales bacterium]